MSEQNGLNVIIRWLNGIHSYVIYGQMKSFVYYEHMLRLHTSIHTHHLTLGMQVEETSVKLRVLNYPHA